MPAAVMKSFIKHVFDQTACRQQVGELKAFLESSADLQEAKQIRPFFKARPQLAALVGSYNPRISRLDRIAWEFDLFGDFACDLVVGDSARKAYSFVEFEGAGPSSVFKKQGARAVRAWSPDFEHGYSQLIDWFYKLHDRHNSDELDARFGKRSIDFMGILIIGRDRFQDAGERLRLEWRREHVIVHSKKIHCVTFDELLDDLTHRLEVYPLAAQAES